MSENGSRPAASPRTRMLVALGLAAALTAALFLAVPDSLYDWAKAIHVVAVISWMAGMLYLPRLFVYHAEVPVGSPQSETFKVMERRLLRAIMASTWAIGVSGVMPWPRLKTSGPPPSSASMASMPA